MSDLPLARRVFCAGAVSTLFAYGTSAFAAPLPPPPSDIIAAMDFDELWRTLGERYCFFGDKATSWRKVRAVYRPKALAVKSVDELSRVVHQVLNELYDAHTHLNDAPVGTPRWAGFDFLVEREGAVARVVAVNPGSAAATAGLKRGDVVTHVEGAPIAQAAASHLPRCLSRRDPEAVSYAWNVAVAGRKGLPRTFTVQRASEGAPATVTVPLAPSKDPESLSWKRLEGGLGYVRIPSFADTSTVEKFDAALEALKDAPGLLLDVRGNGGGDTSVARPMMGRFIHDPKIYARMRRRQGVKLTRFWAEQVEPRGPFTYEKPVVVLVDHWSGSMAEGFPMGMHHIADARIVGTKMAALGAAVFPLRLDRTGITLQYSAEPVYAANGQPRWQIRPDVEVKDTAEVLDAGIAEVRRLIETR